MGPRSHDPSLSRRPERIRAAAPHVGSEWEGPNDFCIWLGRVVADHEPMNESLKNVADGANNVLNGDETRRSDLYRPCQVALSGLGWPGRVY